MKKLLLLIFTTCIAIAAMAQSSTESPTRIAISLGPEVAFVQRSIYNIGYSASAKVEVPVTANFSLGVSGGIEAMHIKRFAFDGLASKGGTDTYIPVKGSLKYYPDNKVYLEGELGTALAQGDRNDKLFAYSLGTGFLIPTGESAKRSVDIGLRYESWSENRMQAIAIRVAYRLGW